MVLRIQAQELSCGFPRINSLALNSVRVFGFAKYGMWRAKSSDTNDVGIARLRCDWCCHTVCTGGVTYHGVERAPFRATLPLGRTEERELFFGENVFDVFHILFV